MNESIKMNASFARSFLSFGIAVAILTAGLFIFKYFTGYSEIEAIGDYKNCSVSVRKETEYTRSRRHHRKRVIYYVTIQCPELDYDQTFQCKRSYYEGFSEYNGRNDVRLKFFKSDEGIVFPTYHFSADEREAELEYRKIYPPYGWNILYMIGSGLAFVTILMGLNAKRTAAINAANPVKTAPPTKEQNEMAAEIDRLLAQDKYGKYRNKKYK